MSKYTEFFKALSDEKRLKVFLLLLNEQKGFYVCEIADAISETHYNTSKYLKELRLAGFIKEKKLGRGVLYSAVEPEDDFLKNMFEAMRSIRHDYIDENIKIIRKRVKLRVDDKCIMNISKFNQNNLKKNQQEVRNGRKIRKMERA